MLDAAYQGTQEFQPLVLSRHCTAELDERTTSDYKL
jgi:hypothetical protein